jgi:hypothetical protein
MSHQYALLADVPKPSRVPVIIRWVLNHYAPAQTGVGFHFKRYAPHIFFPIIRDAIRNQQTSQQNKFTVYLPAYADSFICSILTQIPQTQWEVFSKHCTKAYSVENVTVQPPSGTAFQASMAKATGVLCGAGFETPAEALFLKKNYWLFQCAISMSSTITLLHWQTSTFLYCPNFPSNLFQNYPLGLTILLFQILIFQMIPMQPLTIF